jgi:hypothetical protein
MKRGRNRRRLAMVTRTRMTLRRLGRVGMREWIFQDQAHYMQDRRKPPLFRKRPRAQGGKDPGRPEWDIRIRPRVHQPHTIRQTVHSNLEFPPVNREVREPSVCLLQVHAYGNKKKEETFRRRRVSSSSQSLAWRENSFHIL